MKNILVTGGTGYIGSHTVVELLDRDYNVIIIDNLSNSKELVLDRIEQICGKRPQFYKGDIRSKTDLKKVFEFTNFSLNVWDYIVPAIKNWLISEVLQIRNTDNLENYIKNFKNKDLKNKDIILNLDLDFFEPDLDFIDFDLKKEVVLDAFNKAKVVTICTSPFFIKQDLALKSLKKIFQKIL